MTTLLLSHPDCLGHDTGLGHPERPDRMRAIERVLSHEMFQALKREDAPLGDLDVIALAHSPAYVEHVRAAMPTAPGEHAHLDGDTPVSAGSWAAALRSAGAAIRATDAVMSGEVRNAFCATRPPGHHAERHRPMGFCLFSNAAVAALHARKAYGAERLAVIDFDVHHGNGTQDIFWPDRNLFYASTHQMPLYPGTGELSETGVAGNICNLPLRAGDGGERFKEAVLARMLPALRNFHPDLLIVSAGFDAHHQDPIGGLELTEQDFAWITDKLVESADRLCDGRVVSVLEGGYDLAGLARSVGVHVGVLMQAGT